MAHSDNRDAVPPDPFEPGGICMFGERLRRGASPEAANAGNQRLYLNGTRVVQMSDTQPIDINSAARGIGRHVSGIADPFNGHVDAFRISHIQRSDGWIATTWNNMSAID
jgi:hypothetical protein